MLNQLNDAEINYILNRSDVSELMKIAAKHNKKSTMQHIKTALVEYHDVSSLFEIDLIGKESPLLTFAREVFQKGHTLDA